MNLQFYFEKLEDSDSYKKFKKENPDAFFCGGFFVIDKINLDGGQQHLDFYSEKLGELISFCINEGCIKKPQELSDENWKPIKFEKDIDFNFDEIEVLLFSELDKAGIKPKVQKFLFSLQKHKGINYLIGTIFLPKLSLVKFKINLQNNKVEEFEKKSFFDIIRKG